MQLDKISLLILTTALVLIKTINLPGNEQHQFTSQDNLQIIQSELSSDLDLSNFTTH